MPDGDAFASGHRGPLTYPSHSHISQEKWDAMWLPETEEKPAPKPKRKRKPNAKVRK